MQTMPSPDDVVWAGDLVSRARGELLTIVERFERDARLNEEHAPITLEQYGGLMMVSRDVREDARDLGEIARQLEAMAYEMFRANEGAGVVPSALGVESYVDYRRRLATRFRAEAEHAEAAVANLEDGGAS